jgi:hypothetical protein
MLKFGGIWPCGLGVTAVQSWITESIAIVLLNLILCLCKFDMLNFGIMI